MHFAPQHTKAIRMGIVCAAVFAAAMVTAPRATAEEWTKSYSISGRAQVRVDTNDGAVRISTGDSKQVEFRVEYQGYELNKHLHVESRQDGDTVQINARVTGHWGFSWNGNHRGLRIEVRMPKDAEQTIAVEDGKTANAEFRLVKIAPNAAAAPTTGLFLDLDADGTQLSSDFYLRLAGAAGRVLHGQAALTPSVPVSPM